MAYTNSSLVSYTKLSPNHSGQRTHSIDRITPHCVVGQCSVETLGNIFLPTSRQASCNYGIGVDGRVGMYVEEKNRSWCSSSSANDQRAITIECASDTTEPYAFKDVVYQKLITLCVDICKRNGKKKLLWLGNKDKTLSYEPKSDEMVLTVHRWFVAAAVVCCGGGYVAMQNEKKVKQENVQISEMLDKLPDITVKEGESLPDLKNNIEDTSMIEPDTLKVDIQNVDITVPGTYDVVYSFKDIHGNERSKTVQCKVEANLLDHVYGMDDIETDCGKELPKDETTFDEEYVSSVTRDDSEVDIDTPGTYNITYTVLGTDGSMEEADRLAKVLETAETTQAPEEIVETPVPTEETTPETGNVEPIEQETVKTGDNTNVTGWIIAGLTAGAAGIGAVLYRVLGKKRRKN